MSAIIAAEQVTRRSRGSKEIYREQLSPEIVFGVVGHIGSGNSVIGEALKKMLKDSGYDVEILKARDEIATWAKANGKGASLAATKEKSVARVELLQDLGDEMRSKGDHAIVARALIRSVREMRAKKRGVDVVEGRPVEPDEKVKRAYVLDSLRHPAEVELLRRVYGSAFALIGVVCSEERRFDRLANKLDDAGHENAKRLMERDAKAKERHGQRVLDAFHRADYFIDNTAERHLPAKSGKKPNPAWDIVERLKRLVRIITHAELERPTVAETAIYTAHGAQMRSACLSRQVGACLVDRDGNILATGSNEVPHAGGGVYSGPVLIDGKKVAEDGRCAFRDDDAMHFCSNTREQNEIIDALLVDFPELLKGNERKVVVSKLRESRIGSLLEFSRAVHAEMEALLSAGRGGSSTVGSTMYVTTFPCHYCARHIVSAGVDEVQYIEPYPKSQAFKLHSDAITDDPDKWKPPSAGGGQRVLFKPFTGVAPRMYARAFLKDRDLKDDETGTMRISDPEWGASWYLARVSYVELEAKLSSDEAPK